MASEWTGKTYLLGTERCAQITNDLSEYIDRHLLDAAVGTIRRGVKAEIETENSRKARIARGLEIPDLRLKSGQGLVRTK